jgi:cell fate regulator YaaT (PSP1 superfamily)
MERYRLKEEGAVQTARERARQFGLPIKVVHAEYNFDGSRLTVFFNSEQRVDFRDVVKDLARVLRTRVEMRQIGVRDEARLLTGYGSCGRPLCCTTWLQSFDPVSIKMAKQQNLSLNPSKLSGLCGRLKCCLRYELPNGKGDRYAGCAHERTCSGGGCSSPGAGCSSGCGGGCGSCAP